MFLRKHVSIIPTICLTLLCYILNSLAYAEVNPKWAQHNYFWLNVGVGWGNQLPVLGLGISYQLGRHHLISIRGVTSVGMGEDEFVSVLGDVGILYGYSSKTAQSRGYYSFAMGLSYVNGRNYEATVGIPIEVQLILILKSKHPQLFGGVGLYGFANINSEKSFVGLLLCFQLGRLW